MSQGNRRLSAVRSCVQLGSPNLALANVADSTFCAIEDYISRVEKNCRHRKDCKKIFFKDIFFLHVFNLTFPFLLSISVIYLRKLNIFSSRISIVTYKIYKNITRNIIKNIIRNRLISRLYFGHVKLSRCHKIHRQYCPPVRFQGKNPGVFSTDTSFEVAARKDFNPVTT